MELSQLLRHRDRIVDLVETFPDDAPYIYLVVSSTDLKFYAKEVIAKTKGPLYVPRVRLIDLYSLNLLHGVDPLLVYIDDYVYDCCTSKQMSELHRILDARDNLFVMENEE